MKNIDVKEVIKRLKRELNLKYDAELARQMGIQSTYLGAMKSRGEFTGTAWNKILALCNKRNIDVNYVVFDTPAREVPESELVVGLIRRIVADGQDADDLVGQVEEAKERYAKNLPKEAYREELLRFAQKLIEAAL